MKRDVLLIGGGGHACVVADAIRLSEAGWRLAGIVDPASSELARHHGVPHFTNDEEACAAFAGGWAVLGVGQLGASAARERIVARYTQAGVQWASVIHPSAVIAKDAVIGEGTVVLAGAVVQPRAKIGRQVILNTRSVAEHDARVGDFSVLCPAVVLGGGAVVEERVFMGMGVLCRDHVRVGAGAVIGMGAVILKDVPHGGILRAARP